MGQADPIYAAQAEAPGPGVEAEAEIHDGEKGLAPVRVLVGRNGPGLVGVTWGVPTLVGHGRMVSYFRVARHFEATLRRPHVCPVETTS